jgi:hypothetical protein
MIQEYTDFAAQLCVVFLREDRNTNLLFFLVEIIQSRINA